MDQPEPGYHYLAGQCFARWRWQWCARACWDRHARVRATPAATTAAAVI